MKNYFNSLPQFQHGFALPLVMLLGIGITFVLSTLVVATSASSALQDQAERFARREALQVAYDKVLQEMLIQMNDSDDDGFHISLGSSNTLDNCFSQYDSNSVLAAKGLITNPNIDHDVSYAVRQVSRTGHAVVLDDSSDKLITSSFGRYGITGNFALDMWVNVTQLGTANLVKTGSTNLLTLSTSGTKAQISVLENAHSVLFNPNEWVYVLLTRVNGTLSLYTAQTGLSTPTTASLSSPLSGGDWEISTNTADFKVASVRGWDNIPSGFSTTAQLQFDRKQPGIINNDVNWAVFIDADSPNNDFASQWALSAGTTDDGTSALTLSTETYAYGLTTAQGLRFAPPGDIETFFMDLCIDGEVESHRVTFRHEAFSETIRWLP